MREPIGRYGETLEVSNLKKFCRENNLLPNKMCLVGKGIHKHHRGYTCKKYPFEDALTIGQSGAEWGAEWTVAQVS